MEEDELWRRLKRSTRARINLGRAGDALPTGVLLAFQLAHARARDAVHQPMDVARLCNSASPARVITMHSAAPDRATYLRRPDLGRRLSEESRQYLRADAELRCGAWDILFVLADGLSPVAVMRHALPVLSECLDRLADHSVGPLVVVEQGRVAIGDEIGQIAAARIVIVMIGERPGLSVADSLGLYLTWNPRIGSVDSQRNCISNIHADGLSHAQAGYKAAWLIREAGRRQLTGVALKDGSDVPAIDHGQDRPALMER